MSSRGQSNLLVDIKRQLDEFQVYEPRELDSLCRSLRQPGHPKAQNDPELARQLEPALTRFAELYPGPQEEFRSKLSQYIQLYPSLAQSLPSEDDSLERLFVFGRFLLSQLPGRSPEENSEVAEGATLTSYDPFRQRSTDTASKGGESRDVAGPERGKSREIELVRQLGQELPSEVVRRFRELTAVRQAEALTIEEHEELLRLTELLEELNLERMQRLSELARLRHASLGTVMDDLGIQPLIHA